MCVSLPKILNLKCVFTPMRCLCLQIHINLTWMPLYNEQFSGLPILYDKFMTLLLFIIGHRVILQIHDFHIVHQHYVILCTVHC